MVLSEDILVLDAKVADNIPPPPPAEPDLRAHRVSVRMGIRKTPAIDFDPPAALEFSEGKTVLNLCTIFVVDVKAVLYL